MMSLTSHIVHVHSRFNIHIMLLVTGDDALIDNVLFIAQCICIVQSSTALHSFANVYSKNHNMLRGPFFLNSGPPTLGNHSCTPHA